MALLKHSFDSSFQVIFEGVVGSGIYGDIAIDDLSLLGQKQCDTITGNGLFTILLKMLLCKSQFTLVRCPLYTEFVFPNPPPKNEQTFCIRKQFPMSPRQYNCPESNWESVQDLGGANKVQGFKKILVMKDLNYLRSKDTR